MSIDCSPAREALGGKEWVGWEESVEETVRKLEESHRAYL